MNEGPLGRFLELALPLQDLLPTYQFLGALGFTEARAGDAHAHRYAVFTDGRISLGLHGREGTHGLVFVRPALRTAVAQLESAVEAGGQALDMVDLDDERLHRVAFADPDGLAVEVLEARTFSPPVVDAASRLGWFSEVMLPVQSAAAAAAFWEPLGFVAFGEEQLPFAHLALTSDTLDLGLYETRALDRPGLLFRAPDLAAVAAGLGQAGVDTVPPPRGAPAGMLCLRSPDGTPLWVLPED